MPQRGSTRYECRWLGSYIADSGTLATIFFCTIRLFRRGVPNMITRHNPFVMMQLVCIFILELNP